MSPSLGAGFVGDDHFHRIVLQGRGEMGARLDPTFDLFSFVPDSERQYLTGLGVLPWWSPTGLRIALARPLTALTHRLDFALWPDTPLLHHLHSAVWFAAGVALVALLYRTVHGASLVAGLAALLFAAEDAHALPAGWLANRNALLCLVLGTAVILCHLAWRRTGSRSWLAAALVSLALALAGGEAAIGALAYVAAWQLAMEDRPWLARLLPLTPYAVVVLAWRALYAAGGYGTANSVMYLDPGRQPLSFLAALPERWTLLMAAQWFQAPVDALLLLPPSAQRVAMALAVVMLAAVVALFWPLARHVALLRFWLLGMTFALVPVCAAFPMDRLLVFAGIGAFGALAVLLEQAGGWPCARGETSWRRRMATALLVLHLPVGAGLLVARSSIVDDHEDFFGLAERQSPRGPETSEQTFVYVNGNDFPVVYLWMIRTARDPASAPRRMALLSSVFSRSELRREDSHTVVITSEGGFLAHRLDRLMARPPGDYHAGERIERPDYVALVRSVTDDGRPDEVAFRFRQVLEHPAYRWLYWKDGRVEPFPLPLIGGAVSLRGPLFRRGRSGP